MFDEDKILSVNRAMDDGSDHAEPLRLLLEGGSKTHRVKMTGLAFFCVVVAVLGAAAFLTHRASTSVEAEASFWHITLVSTLFWISVAQGLVALSAILRIAHASWRYPLTRILDMGSLFGLWMPLLFPILWAARYFIYANGASEPLFQDNVWRLSNPLVWDALAVGTSFAAGWALLFLTSRPDFAMLRDRAAEKSKDRKFYGMLAGAWRGDSRQWRVLRRAEGVLVVVILLSFVGSQTSLGWDFQLAAAHNWESSIFAPLYTLSSLLAGLAACILLITVAGGALRGKGFFTSHQYDNVGKVMVGIGLVWTYFRICDFLTAWYGHTPEEWRIQQSRTVYYPVQTGLMLLGCLLLPVFANFFPSLRKRVWLICTTSVFVLIGVGSQRFLDTVPTFSPKFGILPFAPMIPALAVFVGIGGLFVLTYLIAVQIIPVLSWWGMGKGRTRTMEHKMGNATVTVMVEDPPVWET